MKKILITILFATAIGILLGFYIHNKFKEQKEEIMTINALQEQAYALQVGVFENIENATSLAEKYGGIVVQDENKYRVYIAIALQSLSQIKKYYDNQNIPYYVKTIEINKEFYNTLVDYETILLATDTTNYNEIIKNILKEYKKQIT